jgi:LacI family transcriptional regulator
MPTIKDVADRANVSIATVSRVLNNTRYVSPELDVRVREAIRSLNYEHNTLARNLRRSESLTLGIVIPDSNNPFFAEITKGVEDTCFEQGYMVMLCNTNESPEKAESYLTTLYQHRVAGIIVVSPDNLKNALKHHLDNGYPIVIVDRPVPGVETDMVVSDNYGGAQEAVQHLLDLGHRRIGFVIGNLERETVNQRWQAVVDTLSAGGIELDERLIYREGDYLAGSGYKAAEKLLKLKNPPTAIFAFNDMMAFGVLSYAYDHNIRVPDKLSVIGFDDIAMSSYSVPSLTTVAQPKYALGQQVADILLKRIQGDETPVMHVILPTRLVVRQSTASPPR